MRVTIFGSGYVGLVSGACLAQAGNSVLCVDIDEAKIEQLRQGVLPIFEPGLQSIVESTQETGYLKFTTSAEDGVNHGQFLFIAVGTPPDEDGSADLKHVLAVAESIGRFASDEKIIVDKSTVPVGTSERVADCIAEQLRQRNVDVPFHVVSNPEFLKEGNAVDDFLRPDRIIVGTSSSKAAAQIKALYAPFNRNHDKLLIMDARSAELTKYAANAMLATKISFMNEMANLADQVGADIEHVRVGMGSDPRIGYHFIYPGCGYGGSCFPKDVRALKQTAAESGGASSEILSAVERVNENQKKVLFQKINEYFNQRLEGKVIAVWGLSFKPNTDDMREAPSRVLIDDLCRAGAAVKAFDPEAASAARQVYADQPQVEIVASPDLAADGADALVVVTEWRAFWSPDFDKLKRLLNQPVIFDGRNIYDPNQLRELGFKHYGIGRQSRV